MESRRRDRPLASSIPISPGEGDCGTNPSTSLTEDGVPMSGFLFQAEAAEDIRVADEIPGPKRRRLKANQTIG